MNVEILEYQRKQLSEAIMKLAVKNGVVEPKDYLTQEETEKILKWCDGKLKGGL